MTTEPPQPIVAGQLTAAEAMTIQRRNEIADRLDRVGFGARELLDAAAILRASVEVHGEYLARAYEQRGLRDVVGINPAGLILVAPGPVTV